MNFTLALLIAVAACNKPGDTLTVPTQPARDAHAQAVVDDAIAALRTALEAAKTARDSATLCNAFPPLSAAMTHLMQVTSPPGVDAMTYAAGRDAVLQIFDGTERWCRTPEAVGVDTLQSALSSLRTEFLDFIHFGA